jgi:hypothetical protein
LTLWNKFVMDHSSNIKKKKPNEHCKVNHRASSLHSLFCFRIILVNPYSFLPSFTRNLMLVLCSVKTPRSISTAQNKNAFANTGIEKYAHTR